MVRGDVDRVQPLRLLLMHHEALKIDLLGPLEPLSLIHRRLWFSESADLARHHLTVIDICTRLV